MSERTNAKDLFTRDEIRALSARSDLAGFWAVGSTWAVIAGAFAVLAAFPHPVTFALAVFVIGGRQLALAILMHEAAHRTLFKTRALNDVLGDWVCARIVWNDLGKYRKHHIDHHAFTRTDRDPDASLSDPFPTSRRGLARKLARDLTGVTGIRRIIGQILMDAGVYEYTVAADVKRRPRDGRRLRDYIREGVRNTSGVVATNLLLAGVLAATGHAWLYAAWFVAYLVPFSVFVRIRSLAEHACTEKTEDALRNTRTTRAGLLARATVAPIRVNYHVEHHLLVSVPYFRLPEMHRMLRERGALAEPPGYLDVLRQVTTRA